jgi:hypothetical protein
MARRSAVDELSITQLEQMLQGRRTQHNKLQRERAKLLQRLDQVDAQIRQLGGGGGARGGAGKGRGAGGRTRPRNEQSLVACIEGVLKDAGKPMKVGDITTGVEKCGYRSTSANFRSIVNQTLIKERKRFTQAGRGLYQLKKAS